ncbi:Hypothetical protein L291_3487 [Acinetobacter guillouiae MSP4-18]|uniref:DUF262 domain-containing protein n=1 Tax=Acinetobacter guillouiae TaxID=106649 RepID=UPI0002CDB489|nr:DUF262 domain-containing protein [Acinetobacter guillouiae]ENU60689.1 hypothetical protein F981_00602 [Acinetobacter guillouiae CIP 63.46]EPH32115.1 Hypothetical protein L291_3487 [Acinetobacter guillouiae MSP4-18]KAB0629873.1 DUF262 domain-containing protein [Acinetobacter guillouiae]
MTAATAMLESRVISLKELYQQHLSIPDYQRPYKWTEKHVRVLFDDLDYFIAGITAKNRDDERYKYRLGTIVLHSNVIFHPKKSADLYKYSLEQIVQHKLPKVKKDIVDGQQRTLTFYLIWHALQARKDQLNKLDLPDFGLDIPACRISQENLRRNYDVVEKLIDKPRSMPLEEYVDTLLSKCEFVIVELSKLSEAFQFFDSQNSRGLDLHPHDLLKAYHLREFDPSEAELKTKAVQQWEQRNEKEVHRIFSHFLYPIRQWTKGEKAFHFGKAQVEGFKGLSLHQEDQFPLSQSYRILHSMVDEYNSDRFRKVDNIHLAYPFQITQTMINGRRFFEWFSHYESKALELLPLQSYDAWVKPLLTTSMSKKIWNVINGVALTENHKDYDYSGRTRTGDGYVRKMLNAFLLAYYDRFGEVEFSSALGIGFIWAYSIRLKQSSIYESSIENHVIGQNLFRRLDQSLRPKDFFNFSLNIYIDVSQTSKAKGIEKLFKEMKYMAE